MRGRVRVRHLYRVVASAAAGLWFIGLNVLPLVHNLDHRNDHSHGPPAVTRVSRTHSHGGGAAHTHVAEVTWHSYPDLPSPAEPVPKERDHDHGKRSILHFAVAILGAEAQDVPEPGSSVIAVVLPASQPAPSVARSLPFARGPPQA